MLLILAIILVPLGLLVISSGAAVRQAGPGAERSGLVWGMIALGTVLLLLALILVGFAAVSMAGGTGSAFGGRPGMLGDDGAVAVISGIVAVGLLFPAGVLEIVIALSVKQGRHAVSRANRFRLRSLVFLGYVLAFGPIVQFCPPLLLALIAFLTITKAHGQQARQGNLLWLLTVAVEQGLPLDEEIEALAMSSTFYDRDKLLRVADRLRGGAALSAALESSPKLVPPTALLAIRVGELTDSLPVVLRQLSRRQARSLRELTANSYLVGSIAYFGLVLMLIVSAVSWCMYYIIPKYKAIFDDFGMELPAVSQSLIQVADVATGFAFLWLPLFLLMAWGIWRLTQYFLVNADDLRWRILPRWFPRWSAPSVLRNLSYAVAVEKPLPNVLQTFAEHHHRAEARQRMTMVVQRVESGNDVWQSLENAEILRPAELSLIDAAARVGNLPWALDSLADQIETRRRDRVEWWFDVLRPWPVLLLAVLAGFFALGMFYPLVVLIESLS